ncbi:hypothetical protein GUITHDRAFT_166006 [Guillardia theta CCMP2712]|uniref:Ion transport domain-containing protein n=1 Tax=Guillardia theta (strain CCMP2712) TaxID=905079 RepID=L1IGH3_GUITC|nr:hypothetical protein GUITHDRAFT_166006 [Guillardia theta CCMP2712]EKX35351.1 hypothetical protein GUITHDRAFT_166006 [Guillardia theta CCMP2712]|eukprot:XP_005822331.1 hypothetical protein GUITHDRAFT_166006 [Guillardia theta CCMP2712]
MSDDKLSFVRKELGDQMEGIKKEWENAVSKQHDAPPGLSSSEYQKWKFNQSEKAKKRLSDLEEKLKRLQLLEQKLRRLKNVGEDVQENVRHTPASLREVTSPQIPLDIQLPNAATAAASPTALPAPVQEPLLDNGFENANPLNKGHEDKDKKLNHWDTFDGGDDDKNPEHMHVEISDPKKPKKLLTLEDFVPVSCPYFFGGFNRRSLIRQQCFEIYKSVKWSTFFLMVVLSNSIYIALYPAYIDFRNGSTFARSFQIFDGLCFAVMLFEALCGIIACGLYSAESTWLRSTDMHKIELFIITVTGVEYLGKLLAYPFLNLRAFRLLRIFRILTKIRALAGVKAIILTLKQPLVAPHALVSQGLQQLATIFAMLTFLMAAFAIFGNSIYARSYRRRCVTLSRQIPACASDSSTGWANTCDLHNLSATKTQAPGQVAIAGGYPFETWCKIYAIAIPAGQPVPENLTYPVIQDAKSIASYNKKYPRDPYGRYHSCQMSEFDAGKPVTEMCDDLGREGNPNNGFANFDNIGDGMLVISQLVAPDSSYDFLLRSIESEPEAMIGTYFLWAMITILCTFLMVGIFVAVVTGTFKKVREASQTGKSGFLESEEDAELEDHTRTSAFSDIMDDNTDGEAVVQKASARLLKNKYFRHFTNLVMMVHGVAMAGNQYDAPIFVCLFIMSWFVFASLILNNLFVAVIIENFEISVTIENIGKPGNAAKVRELFKKAYEGFYKANSRIIGRNLESRGQSVPSLLPARSRLKLQKLQEEAMHEALPSAKADDLIPNYHQGGADESHISKILKEVTNLTVVKTVVDEILEERVLFFFYPYSPIRRFFVWLGKQYIFDLFVYSAILGSCFFLIITPPYEDMGYDPIVSYTAMAYWNRVFVFVFTVEFGCKIMANGLYFTQTAYLKSGWNKMDTLVLMFAWIEESGVLTQGKLAKVVRMSRALRPLRLMKRNEGMRVVIDALISTLLPVWYVIIFAVFTFIVGALMAVGLFGGKLKYCNTPVADFPLGKKECMGYYVNDAGYMIPSAWNNPDFNFDSFYSAMISLFRVTTFKYVSIIFACMDITNIDQSPSTNYSPINSLFFVVYLIIGGLFVMNLFVGFIIDGFNANKGSSPQEVLFHRFTRQVNSHRPYYEYFKRPKNIVSTLFQRVAESRTFQTWSTTCVCINVIFMLMENTDSGKTLKTILTLQNDVFFGLLVFEVCIFLIAYGPGGFYNDPWKGFDLFVALGTGSGYIANNPKISAGARVFRLMRVIRLMKAFKPIRIIMETFLQSIKQLLNIVVLLFLVYSMFAVVFVQVFGVVKYGSRIGPTANFETFPVALQTIFQLVTGDEWQSMMVDCQVSPPACTLQFEGKSFGDCGSSLSFPWFVFFKLVCESVMLNLFIGMILDNFSYITDDVAQVEDSSWTHGASGDQIAVMSEVFQRYDGMTGRMPLVSLHSLLLDLPAPLGFLQPDESVQYGPYEKACEVLVRAELNLAVRHENNEISKRHGFLQRFLRLGGPKKPKFSSSVYFEDLMLVLLYWRVPRMVPEAVKEARMDRVEEVALMAYALIIHDFFRLLVARRKKAEIRDKIADRFEFRNWSKKDLHYSRRLKYLNDVREVGKTQAQAVKLSLYDLLVHPQETVVAELRSIDMIPEDMVDHASAIRQLHLKAAKPINGIEVFRNRLVNSSVVLKALDPGHKQMGYMVADFTRLSWNGWCIVNLEQETFFQPSSMLGHGTQPKHGQGHAWTRVDLYLKSSNKKFTRRKLGSILDIQSFVIADRDVQQALRSSEKSRSFVRLNTGSHLYQSQKLQAQQAKRSKKKKQSRVEPETGVALDTACVLEVIGYISHHLSQKELDDDGEEETTIREEETTEGVAQSEEGAVEGEEMEDE